MARDCLSEGMQRSSAPKLCSGPPAVSRASPWHTLEAPHPQHPAHPSHTGSHHSEHKLLLCPHPTRAPNPSMGAALRTPSTGWLQPNSTSPISTCGCHQPCTGLPSLFLGHQPQLQPPVLVPVWGLVSAPLGGGTSILCRYRVGTQEAAFLFLVNGTKTLPQIINSSPSSLYQPLEAFRVWLSGSNHSPCRYPQACGKDYQQWLSPLLHPARKGPFTALGTCSPGEPQAEGCTCITPGPNLEHHPNILQQS